MKKIETISVPVSDQEKSKEFYVEKLGFKVIIETDTPQGKWLQLTLPDDSTSVSLVSGPMHAAPGSLKGTIISTNNITREFEALKEKGIELPDIQDLPFGKIVPFADPDGNQWVLREAPNY